MDEKEFYNLNTSQKVLICIASFFTVLSGCYYFAIWYSKIFDLVKSQYIPYWLNVAITIIVLILILLFVSIIVWFSGSYTIKLFPKGKKEIKINSAEFISNNIEKNNNYIETYKNDKGLGEIAFYWGQREDANDDLTRHMKSTNSKNIFISAIGFNTMKKVLLDINVQDNLSNLILQPQSSFKITIIFPAEADPRIRPDKTKEELEKSIQEGIITLKRFKEELSATCVQKIQGEGVKEFNINSYIEFKNYKDVIPRHFILKDDYNIFVGSYLSHTVGKKSYLMKLRTYYGNEIKIGLYDLFRNEINHIKNKSIKTDMI